MTPDETCGARPSAIWYRPCTSMLSYLTTGCNDSTFEKCTAWANPLRGRALLGLSLRFGAHRVPPIYKSPRASSARVSALRKAEFKTVCLGALPHRAHTSAARVSPIFILINRFLAARKSGATPPGSPPLYFAPRFRQRAGPHVRHATHFQGEKTDDTQRRKQKPIHLEILRAETHSWPSAIHQKTE